MQYVVVEHFRAGDPRRVYARFGAHERLAPEGLAYVTSWVTADLTRCSNSWNARTAHCSTSGCARGKTSSTSRCFRC